MSPRHLILTSGLLLGCPSSFTNTGDASVDRSSGDLFDAADAADRFADAPDDAAADRPDLPDTHPDTETRDVASEDVSRLDGGDASPACAQDPPSGPPPGTHRSCATGQAPSWHCREVHHCGGSYIAGSLDAFELGAPRPAPSSPRMRGCDLHQGIVHPGYVDAYEVTVARFRAWVRAGMPIPRGGQDIFNGLVWDPRTKPVVPATFANSRDIVPGHTTSSSMCTYTEEPGPNDDLPVNCVSANTALLFCWWDGKHLATEVAWEYLARNRGTTATPFGDLPSDAEACRYGDVGAFNGLCPPERLPQRVDAFPLGATRDPAGIYGLYGGVMEFVIGGSRRPYGDRTEMCRSLTSAPITDGLDLGTLVHGTAWYQSLIDHQRYRHAATRGSPPVQDSALDPMLTPARSPRVGFRCMRWTPEPRDP